MSLINYKDIDFNQSINKETKKINFNGSEIEIVNYLSANDKYDLIMITLQKALDKNIYNPFKIDMYFDLHIIYMYTNIVFDNEDRLNEEELYDILKQSGLIKAVIDNIDSEELILLKEYIYQLTEIIIKYRNTFGSVLGNFIEQLPANMEKANEIINNIDVNKFEGLMEMVKQIPQINN